MVKGFILQQLRNGKVVEYLGNLLLLPRALCGFWCVSADSVVGLTVRGVYPGAFGFMFDLFSM